jgi:hypothetical protein
MVSKKISVFTGFLFLVILFLGFASAESCDVRLRTECQTAPWNNIVMGLSSLTNAHGEITGSSPYVLCCDFYRANTCSGTNKIIGLSSDTNAHAQIPESGTYGTSVCYGNFECRSTTGSCNNDEMDVLSLSLNLNAHIGSFADYSTKICCGGICDSGYTYINGQCEPITTAYWADMSGNFISNIDVDIIASTTVKMLLKNSGLSEGTEVSFEIYEDDVWPNPNDDIKTMTGIVDSNGHVTVSWTITQEDLDKTNDLDNFKFEVNDEVSDELTLTIMECSGVTICSNYDSQNTCNSDTCEVSSNSASAFNTECEDPIICGCSWNETETQCNFKATYYPITDNCGNGLIDSGETCDGNEWGTFTTNCNDFNSSWTGNVVSCNYCDFDTSLCTGESGIHGDGIINPGEACDGDNLNDKSCSDFDDFTGGELSCDDSYFFDTFLCNINGEIVGREEIGTCIEIIETTTNECEEGYLTYLWTGTWEEGTEIGCGDECITCRAGGENSITCPAQIQLPFFGFYNIIIILVLIILIYVILNLRKKKRKYKK